MIALLTGTVRSESGTSIVIEVSGIGYKVAVRSIFDFKVGTTTTLYTHLAVRENALDLYGFLSQEELGMFEALIRLPKIGPKTAMQILIQADAATLRSATQQNDPAYLTKMSGIGKKTAEKVVAGLRDIFEDDPLLASPNSPDADVIDALIALGYSQKEVRDVVQKIPSDVTDPKRRIGEALRLMGS
jgi:holliday junction DNA helicase RuvA